MITREVFIGMCLLVGLFTGTGIGVLCLVDAAMPGRSTSNPSRVRLLLLIPGAFLLVGGICLVTTILASLSVRVVLARLDIDDAAVELFAAVAVALMLSLFPLAGGLLLGASGLIARERSDAETRKLYRYLDALTVTGWSLAAIGVVFALFCLPLFGLLGFFFVSILLVSVFGMRRSAQRDGLLWVLAIASRQNMPLAPAVREYANQCHGRYRGWLLQLADKLAAGVSLPDALDSYPRLLAPDARLAARVGWDTGTLGEVLRSMVVTQSVRRPVWHGVVGRLLYLALPVIVLQLVGGFMIYFIAPKFRKIFYDFGVPLPASTEMIHSVAQQHLAGITVPFLLIVEISVALYLVIRYMGWGNWNFPLLDRIFRSADRALLLRTLAVYIDRGRPLIDALRTLENTYPKLWIRLRLALALESMAYGESWSESLLRYGLIRGGDVGLFESAQRVGNLAWALREIADRDERRLGYWLQIASDWLFPLILLTIAALVFAFVVSFFQPLIRLITEVSEWSLDVL